jgi:hypothetical protein
VRYKEHEGERCFADRDETQQPQKRRRLDLQSNNFRIGVSLGKVFGALTLALPSKAASHTEKISSATAFPLSSSVENSAFETVGSISVRKPAPNPKA